MKPNLFKVLDLTFFSLILFTTLVASATSENLEIPQACKKIIDEEMKILNLSNDLIKCEGLINKSEDKTKAVVHIQNNQTRSALDFQLDSKLTGERWDGPIIKSSQTDVVGFTTTKSIFLDQNCKINRITVQDGLMYDLTPSLCEKIKMVWNTKLKPALQKDLKPKITVETIQQIKKKGLPNPNEPGFSKKYFVCERYFGKQSTNETPSSVTNGYNSSPLTNSDSQR